MEKHLIFDFDGVIGDTQDASAKATMEVDGSTYEGAWAENLRYSSEKPDHSRGHTLSDEEMRAIYEWTTKFGTLMRDAHFPLFDEFVKEIEKIDTKYKAVVSSGSQLYVIPALAETNINPTHILAYENHHSKEEKIETICKDWGCEVSDVYYFTDTLADIYELQNFISPDKLIGVAWGYCGKEALSKELDEGYILCTPCELTALLEG
tara:strand:- start:679 stop:1299 length:621 start_codon:yes stop_codon:yes gene_type:complete